MKESDRDKGLIGYAGIKIGAVLCPCVIVLEDSNGERYKVLVKRLPEPPPTHPLSQEGEPPTDDDHGWNAKSGDDFVNVACFDTETSFEWCGNLIPARVFDKAVQRSVYHVNTAAPVVFKPGIRFEQGNVKGALSSDRVKVTVTWPTAVTQPKGRPVKYELTLWDRADCPKDSAPCNGHAYIPVLGTCDSSKTECTVVFSTMGRPSNAPPLTADTLKSMSVIAKDPDGHIALKEANFTARLAPPPTLGQSDRNSGRTFVRIGRNSNSSSILTCPMNGQFVDGYGYSFRCFRRGELIRLTKYLNRLMKAWAANRHACTKRRSSASLRG